MTPGCARVVADAGSIIGEVVVAASRRRSTRSASSSAESSPRRASSCSSPLREAIRQRVLLNQIAPLEVVPAELGQRAEVVGALELVLRSTDFVVRSDEQARSAGDELQG